MSDQQNPHAVRITNRPDGLGLLVLGLEHAQVRRLVLVADPLVPPRVFVELVGADLELDVTALLAGEVAPEPIVADPCPECGADRTPCGPPTRTACTCWSGAQPPPFGGHAPGCPLEQDHPPARSP